MLKTTFEQWRMLRDVVDHGGFSQAAEAIHKSQSTINHAVHKLEEVLGVQLLEVKGRKAFLTDAGALMLRRARYVLDEAAKMEAVANSLSAGEEVQLKIAVDGSYPQDEMYKVLDTVSSRFPQVCIELVETVLSGANELVQQGKVDIALSPYPITGFFNDEICQIDFVAVAAPHHALHALDRKIAFEDLKTHRQIVVRDSALQTNRDEGWLGAEQRWTVSHARTSIDLVSKGFGYAWLPVSGIAELLTSRTLVPLPLISGQTRTVLLYLILADVDQLGPVARTFISELRYQSQRFTVPGV